MNDDAMEVNQATDPPCKQYSNFVKASIQKESNKNVCMPTICGLEARRMYLEEVTDVSTSLPTQHNQTVSTSDDYNEALKTTALSNTSSRDLITAVQNNDSEQVRIALTSCPDRVNTVDDFGWSLLMIACQANSVETAKELLKQGADLSFRDKAGNSARSLVIKNKNATLASLILGHKTYKKRKSRDREANKKVTELSEFTCDICDGRKFADKNSHMASTLHNINVSKGRKIPSSYKIPESNKGFQIMLKSGWDKDIGLGASGSGIKYPIKCEPKKDRKGLGNQKCKKKESKHVNVCESKQKKIFFTDRLRDRFMEVNFRREFY